MKYYFFPLTPEECNVPSKTGLTYAVEQKDRWVETDVLIEVNTYDRGTTHLVNDGKAYMIYKDYVDLTNQYRLYIGKPSMLGADN